jgi:CRISPR system Cascade subunit CasE
MTTEKQTYLSRLILNPKCKDVQSDLADCQKLHCRVMYAFPKLDPGEEKKARERLGVLYRVDYNKRQGTVTLLVQSQEEPLWSLLPENYLQKDLDSLPNPVFKPISEYYFSIKNADRFCFRLRANPTRRISEKCTTERSGKAGKRVELYREDDQIQWLRRKSETAGFRILDLRLNENVLNLRASPETKTFSRAKQLTFGSVLFEGELEITNAEDFQKALTGGLGTGKAYGFGLLSIAPSQQ